MNNHESISYGIILRCTLSFLVFIWLAIKRPKHLYLILPIALTILDLSDIVFFNIYNHFISNEKQCYATFEYQIADKTLDCLSYLVFLFLKIDYVTLFFIVYRMLGVLLFYTTRNMHWGILFFDFVKEYMLYLYFFGKNYNYLWICVALKIAFEYFFHTVVNGNNYNEKSEESMSS